MTRQTLLAILPCILFFSSCSELKSDNVLNQNTESTVENTYPFKIIESGDRFTITAWIESQELFDKYGSLFEKHGYLGNGYCWEGHIIQILEKIDKELLNHIDFDPEAGAFYCYADSEAALNKFIELLSPIFSDLKQLEKYVKSADRARVDD